MNVRAFLWVVVACGAACGSEPKPTEVQDRKPPEPAKTQVGIVDNALRIDPEMLRDLRTTTAAVEARAGHEEVSMLGELRVNENAYAEVGAPVAARVVRIIAPPGARVRRGQSLIELQSVELGRTDADYRTAVARLELARQTLQRKRELVAERIVPQREVQEAEADAAAGEATLRATESALRAFGVSPETLEGSSSDPSRFALRSPIPGTVIERTVSLGQLADPSDTLFKIADLSRLWLTVHAFERDAVRVKVGAPARVAFPALPGRTFDGRVALVGRQVDPSSRTIPLRIDVANPGEMLRPGMSATAWVGLDEEGSRVIAVPAASVQRLEDAWYVFLPKGRGVFEMRRVGRGRDLGAEVEIVSGLRPGEVVVVDGAFLLRAEAEKSRGEGVEHGHREQGLVRE